MMRRILCSIGGLALALCLSSCATSKEIVGIGTMPPAALQTATSVVVFVVDCDALRMRVNGNVDWWDTTIGQGIIFFPIIGPIRYPDDADYEAKIRPLREPHLNAWRAQYLQALEKSVRLAAATSLVFKLVSTEELRQGIFPGKYKADYYVDCTPRFSMGSSYWQWAEPNAILSAITGPIVIESGVAERVGRELANMYEQRPSHSTVYTSLLWQTGKFPFEGCFREYTVLTSEPHKKNRWLAAQGKLLDEETRRLLGRLAAEVNYTLQARVGALR